MAGPGPAAVQGAWARAGSVGGRGNALPEARKYLAGSKGSELDKDRCSVSLCISSFSCKKGHNASNVRGGWEWAGSQ